MLALTMLSTIDSVSVTRLPAQVLDNIDSPKSSYVNLLLNKDGYPYAVLNDDFAFQWPTVILKLCSVPVPDEKKLFVSASLFNFQYFQSKLVLTTSCIKCLQRNLRNGAKWCDVELTNEI